MNIVNPVDIVPTTIAAVYDDLASPRRRDPRPPSAGSIQEWLPEEMRIPRPYNVVVNEIRQLQNVGVCEVSCNMDFELLLREASA